MTFDGHHRPRNARRKLSEEDLRLWNAVARSIRPLRSRARALDPAESDAAPAKPRGLVKPSKPVQAAPAARHHGPAAKPAPKPATIKPVIPLSPLDRRERQRLARGTAAIDARIDLHGLTQAEAHAALAHFLRRAQADGVRFALVITGKGARLGAHFSDRGVLRRQVPLWLKLPELRAYVVGFEDAHAAHGGEGAIYVRIRRARA